MLLKTLLGLIITNLIWSAHPIMGKFVLADFTPVQGAWLRYMSAFLGFCLFVTVLPKLRAEPRAFRGKRFDWIMVVFMGGMAFCVSPLLQLTGLRASSATDNSLIIAMEPIITVLLAWLFLKEKITLAYAATLLTALMGFALLAGVSAGGLVLSDAHLFGDVIMLASLLGEGFYSICGSKLVSGRSPIAIFGWASLSGVVFLTLAVAVLSGSSPLALLAIAAHQVTWRSAFALFWLGPLGTAAAYLYWIYALKEAPVASIALTLFIQPVLGALWGYLFLGERLTLSQNFGGILIILAVFAQTLGSILKTRTGRQSLPLQT